MRLERKAGARLMSICVSQQTMGNQGRFLSRGVSYPELGFRKTPLATI